MCKGTFSCYICLCFSPVVSKSNGGHYVALGISNDDRMGDDLVFTCKSPTYKKANNPLSTLNEVRSACDGKCCFAYFRLLFKIIYSNYPNTYYCATSQFNVKWSKKDGTLDQQFVETTSIAPVRIEEKGNILECEFYLDTKMDIPKLGMRY